MNEPKRSSPLWETVTMCASFVLIWAWFLARQSAKRTGAGLWPGWEVLLWLSVIVLAVIMVRRILRVRRALRGEDGDVNPVTKLYPPLNKPTRR